MAIDFKILDEKENKLLARREVMIKVSHAGETTPSRPNLQQLVAKYLKADPEFTEVSEIRSGSGEAVSHIRIYVWSEKKVGLHTKKEKTAPVEKK